jgi:thioredoxin 1
VSRIRISTSIKIVLSLSLLGISAIVNADPGNSIGISELNDSTVNSMIADHSLFVLDCYSPLCGPCMALNSTLSELSRELNEKVAIGRINVQKNNVTKNEYKIHAYPTILVFNNGTLVNRQIGFRSKSEFVDLLRKSKPGLDLSHVNLTVQPQTISTTGEIPLTKLGEAQPVLPMLVNDNSLQFALNNYPFFVLEGYADWCNFCKKMNDTVSMLSADLKGQVAFGLINAEKNNATRNKYNIPSFPTLMIFKNGTLIDTQIGYKPEPEFALILKSVEPNLDIGRINLTAQTQPLVAQQLPSSKQATISSGSETDATLRYLDRILNVTKCNSTTGVTINVFIIDWCPS